MTDTTISDSTAWNAVTEEGQYSLAKILGIWAAAAVPMAVLGWVVFPAVAPDFEVDATGAGVTRFLVLTAGLIWQFILSMVIVYREAGDLRWTTVRRRLWLNKPLDPKTGEPRTVLWLWAIPFIILFFVAVMFVDPLLNGLWVRLFPFLAEPAGYGGGALLQSPEVRTELAGAWWFMGLFLLFGLFNTVLGEEFLFRGVLLPKMGGVFGKWDWVANGVLFGFYHLHQPWAIPGSILSGIVLFAFPAKRFRSTWMSIIVHSVQIIFIGFLILMIVLGLS